MGTHRSDDRLPWENAIQDTGGTLCNPYVAASFVKSSYGWTNLQNEFRTQMSNGFTIADGGFEHISTIGTRWLASDPALWWDMQSASISQLKIIQTCSQRSELVLGSLARQGRLGAKKSTSGKHGPSVVEHRWRKMFPDEMAFADQCLSLGIGPAEALTVWKSAHMNENILIDSQDFSELFAVPDLR